MPNSLLNTPGTRSVGQNVRLDDATVGQFMRLLEDIESDVQRVEYADLPFSRGDIVPLDIQNKPWARTVTYRQLDRVGHFKLIRSYATDVPHVAVLSQEFTQNVHKFAGGCYYSDDDIQATVHLGEDLSKEQIQTVTETSEQEMNELIAYGRTTDGTPSGFEGFVNHSAALNSFSPYRLDASSTPTQILAMLNDAVTSVVKLTKQVERPDVLLLPVEKYHYLISARIDPTLPETILEQFFKKTPYIKDIFPVNELEGAGIGGTDIMIAYKRDRTRVKARVMQPLTWNNWERKSLGYERIAFFKYGGLVVYRPLSMHIVTGI